MSNEYTMSNEYRDWLAEMRKLTADEVLDHLSVVSEVSGAATPYDKYAELRNHACSLEVSFVTERILDWLRARRPDEVTKESVHEFVCEVRKDRMA